MDHTKLTEEFDIQEIPSRTLRVHLLPRCNLTCRFCHGEGASGTEAIADIAQLLAACKLVRQVADVDEIHLTGGEPTLHGPVCDVVRALGQAGFAVSVAARTSAAHLSVKLIRHSRDPEICAGCPVDRASGCRGGIYGLRLEQRGGQLWLRRCIHRSDVGHTMFPLDAPMAGSDVTSRPPSPTTRPCWAGPWIGTWRICRW